jgi:hypothetical protein
LSNDISESFSLTFAAAGSFSEDTCFGRWEQCLEHPRLWRIVRRYRAGRRTVVEWTVDGRPYPDLESALSAAAAGVRLAAE